MTSTALLTVQARATAGFLAGIAVAAVCEAGDVVIQPTDLAWEVEDPPNDNFIQQSRERGYDGSGLDNAALVENGAPIPATWPLHSPWGNNGLPAIPDVATRVLRAGTPGPLTRGLTLNFDALYEVDGVALWNWSSLFNSNSDNNRGISTAGVEVSIDGGESFTALDLNGDTVVDELDVLQFNEVPANSVGNTPLYAPDVVSFGIDPVPANAIRLVATNFGAGSIMGIGEIRFTGFATALEGDFNADGTVDAADYTVWRDGDDPTQADYDLWSANFGATSAPADDLVSAIPEPMSAWLAVCGIGLTIPRRRAAV